MLLKPLLWFEKFKRDKDGKVGGKASAAASTEGDPLLPTGLPKTKQTSSAGDKWKQRFSDLAASA